MIISVCLSHAQSSINLQQSVTVKAMTEQAEWIRVPVRGNAYHKTIRGHTSVGFRTYWNNYDLKFWVNTRALFFQNMEFFFWIFSILSNWIFFNSIIFLFIKAYHQYCGLVGNITKTCSGGLVCAAADSAEFFSLHWETLTFNE